MFRTIEWSFNLWNCFNTPLFFSMAPWKYFNEGAIEMEIKSKYVAIRRCWYSSNEMPSKKYLSIFGRSITSWVNGFKMNVISLPSVTTTQPSSEKRKVSCSYAKRAPIFNVYSLSLIGSKNLHTPSAILGECISHGHAFAFGITSEVKLHSLHTTESLIQSTSDNRERTNSTNSNGRSGHCLEKTIYSHFHDICHQAAMVHVVAELVILFFLFFLFFFWWHALVIWCFETTLIFKNSAYLIVQLQHWAYLIVRS